MTVAGHNNAGNLVGNGILHYLVAAVTDDDDIAFLNAILQNSLGAGGDDDTALDNKAGITAYENSTVGGLYNGPEGNIDIREVNKTKLLEITLSQVTYGNDTGQLLLIVHYHNGAKALAGHDLAQTTKAVLLIYSSADGQHYIADAGIYILQKIRQVNLEGFKSIFSFSVDFACTGGYNILYAKSLLQSGIGNSRANGIGVRIAVTDDINRFLFRHWYSSKFKMQLILCLL